MGSFKLWATEENETKIGMRHSATFSRLYRDEKEQWQDSTSFGRDDLPLLGKVADQVHTWIFEQAKTTTTQADSEEVDF